jgi:arylsulfatase
MPFSLEAELGIPERGANGVIVAAGSHFGGWSFYLEDGKPVAYAAASHLPGKQFRVAANKQLATGPNKLRFEFTPAGAGGVVTIAVNGNEVARETIASYPHMMAGTSETFDIGRDANGPVSDAYRNEGIFTGDIKRVQVDMKMPSHGSPAPATQKKAAQGGG